MDEREVQITRGGAGLAAIPVTGLLRKLQQQIKPEGFGRNLRIAIGSGEIDIRVEVAESTEGKLRLRKLANDFGTADETTNRNSPTCLFLTRLLHRIPFHFPKCFQASRSLDRTLPQTPLSRSLSLMKFYKKSS